jgi:putative transposase
MRLVPIYQEPNTSKKHPQHKVWPYLLRNVVIDRPNQVPLSWFAGKPLPGSGCDADSCISWRSFARQAIAQQTPRGVDWHSHKVLAWRLSNSMDAAFCPLGRLLCNRLPAMVEALKEALAHYGTPEIFNTPSH